MAFPFHGQEDLVTDTLDELPLELPGAVAAASNRRDVSGGLGFGFVINLATQRKASNMRRHQNIPSIDHNLKMFVKMFPRVSFPR